MIDTSAFQSVVAALQKGGIAVVRTDTIYGIIALASSEQGVEKMYAVKQRDPSKQCIVLVASSDDTSAYKEIIEHYSEKSDIPTSVIVPATNEPTWVLRGGATIAYRVVRDPFLKKVVEAVGPVIAPSANPESLEPARTIEEAKAYFGDSVDVYVDGGEVPEAVHASRIIRVDADGSVTELRS